MKNSKILFGLLGLMLAIFLISNVSAITTSHGEWQDRSSSLSITNGQSAGFNVYFESTTTPFTVSIELRDLNHLDSQGNPTLVHSFINGPAPNTPCGNNCYFNSAPIQITPAIYSSTGSFLLILSSTDRQGTSTTSLSLTVNPLPPPVNHAPVITSIPNQAINENLSYSYQAVATDADNNTLTYSLSGAPAGFTISSSGLITGTAPIVSADTSFTIFVQVSDGIASVSQTYILTVNNIPPPVNHAPVITTTPVTSVNEGSLYSYDVNAIDSDGDTLTYSLVHAPSWLSINPSTGLVTGTAPIVSADTSYPIVVHVSDGINGVIQPYTLTVLNIPIINHAPVITILGSNPITIQAGFVYVDAGATASDAEDGNLTASITKTSNVNVYIIGNYSVVYSVTDSLGSTVTATRNVHVVDTTAPVITLNGANTITIIQNSTYTELGATALDNYDGFLSVNITGSVNTNVIGTYTITYRAIDSHGNSATPKTRTVNVVSSGSSSLGPSSVTGKTVNPYVDVYEQQYQAQLNKINPQIDLGKPQTPSKTAGFTLFLIIIAILILGLGITIFVLIRKR